MVTGSAAVRAMQAAAKPLLVHVCAQAITLHVYLQYLHVGGFHACIGPLTVLEEFSRRTVSSALLYSVISST